jgi:uncharacterized protein
MIIVDIRKLNAKKSYSGEMEFSYDAPTSLIEIPFVSFEGPVKVRFSYELYEDDAFEIKGTVSFTLKGQCSRCLKDASMDVSGDLDALFEPNENPEDYSYSGGIVRLEKAFDDAIMSCMPFTISCGKDCESIDYKAER